MARKWFDGACLMFLTVGSALGNIASAQDYPNRPIRLIVPFAPGGGSDILARLVGQKLAESTGQTVVIDNRPGGGGNPGTDMAAKSTPNGYTLVLGVIGPIAINLSLYGKLPYDPEKDLAPITQAVSVTNLLTVHPSKGVSTVKELIALAKAQPGKLVSGSGGNGTAGHMAGELFKLMAGVDIVIVPYRGTAPAVTDLVGGQIGLAFEGMLFSLPYAKQGRLKALGVTTSKRSPAAPEIPTIAESGLSGYEANNWYGFLAPAGTPRPIITFLNREIVRILRLPDVNEKLAQGGADVVANSPEQFAAVIRAEIPKWRKVIEVSGIKAQ